MRARGVCVAALLSCALGCTFGGLTDYAVPGCNPSPGTWENDDCRVLPTLIPGSPSCYRYACVDGRCVAGPPDWDRDGHAALECGGDDCDDHDARVHPGLADVCDGIDNDCDGAADEGLLADVELSGGRPNGLGTIVDPAVSAPPDWSSVAAPADAGTTGPAGWDIAYLVLDPTSNFTNACVDVTDRASAAQAGSFLACTFLGGAGALSRVPRQPYASRVGVSYGMVYVATVPCTTLGYASSVGGALDFDCNTRGALPSFATYAGTSTLVLTFLDGTPAADPSTACATQTAESVEVRWIGSADTASPIVLDQAVLPSRTKSYRPVALAAPFAHPLYGDGTRWMFAATPNDTAGVSLWALGAPGAIDARVAAVVPLGHIDGLPSASAAALATRGTDVAVVAELGCAQGVALVAGSVDRNGALHVTAPVEVAPPARGASQPSITAVESADPHGYHEWRVTWLTPSGTMLQRFTKGDVASGKPPAPIDAPIALSGVRLLSAVPTFDGYVVGFPDVGTTGGSGAQYVHKISCR